MEELMETKASVFFDRRQNVTLINFNDRRLAQRRSMEKLPSAEQRRLASQMRQYEREGIKIPISLSVEGRELYGNTENISLGGLFAYIDGNDIPLTAGTPLIVQFSFGEGVCHISLSSQVIFCRLARKEQPTQQAIGIKFTAIRNFEQRILANLIQSLKQNNTTGEKGSLRLFLSKDNLANEATHFLNTSFKSDEQKSSTGRSTPFNTAVITQMELSKSTNGVNFELTDEQKALRETVRKFTQQEIVPVALHYDRIAEFPWNIVRKAYEIGIFTSYIPELYGGAGLGTFETALITEELGAGCMAMGTSIMVNLLGVSPLLIAGTEEQKERFLIPYCQRLTLFSFCFTEPDAGSDPSRIATKAELVGDHYILSGSKCFISNGGVADYYIVFATLNRDLGTKGLTAFLTPSKTDGIRVGKALDKMGQRASNTAEIFFENVKVPKENRIGAEGEGYKIALLSISRSRINVAAGAVGIARTAMEHALKYVQKRVQFNQPLADFQYVRFRLADMAKEIDAARLLTWRAAWVHDQKRRYAEESSMAKDFAADVAMKVTNEALDLLGGYGYSKEFPMEKLMRDAKLMQIYEGPSPIHKTIIYRELASRYGF